MDLNSIYEVTQDSKTRWAYYAHGGDTYLTVSMLQSANILQTVKNGLTDIDAFLESLLRKSKNYVQELNEQEFDSLLESFYSNKVVGSAIKIDFDNNMMKVQRNSMSKLNDDYQIKISDAKAIYAWFSMQTPYCRPEDIMKRLMDFEDEVMRFLDRDNEHLQNCSSKKLRFRDGKGSLRMSVEKLCETTKPEADNYYINGDIYEYQGKRYTFLKTDREAVFIADDGAEMYCDANHLGTFLPDVASEGMAVVRVPVSELRQTLTLGDLLNAVKLYNVQLTHINGETNSMPIEQLDRGMLTGEGKKAWADVLNAKITCIYDGDYGPRFECSDVRAERLSLFSKIFTGEWPTEENKMWLQDVPEEPTQDMRI